MAVAEAPTTPVSGLDAAFEDYSLKPVPTRLTRGWFDMGMIMIGFLFAIPAFMIGGQLATGGGLSRAIVAIAIGALVVTVISIASGVIGAQTRLSTAMSTQFTFGTKANAILAIMLAVSSFGWFGVQLEVAAGALRTAMQLVTGNPQAPVWVFVLIGGALMVLTALYGVRALALLSNVAIPLLLVMMIVTLVRAGNTLSVAEAFAIVPASPMPLGTMVSIVIGGFAVGTVVMPDITRYARDRKNTIWGMVFGMFLGYGVMLILPAFIALAAGTPDFTALMLTFNSGTWGIIAMITIILASWLANDNNIYSTAISLNFVMPTVKKWQITLIAGAFGTLLALGGILMHLITYMTLLSIIFPPMGAVMAADFFLFRSPVYRYSALKSGKLPTFRVEAWIALAIGVLVGLLTGTPPTGFGLLTLTSSVAIDSMLAGFIAYVVIMLVRGQKTQPLADPEVIA